MKKTRFRILFYIRNKKISVYEYKDGEFEVIQDCGEDIIDYNEGFMKWFKKAICYVREINELDYLIITDNSVSLDFSDFDIPNDSCWDKKKISEFNVSKLASHGMILRNISKDEYYKFNVKRNPFEYTVIFCENIVNEKLENKIAKNRVKKPHEKEDINLPQYLDDKNEEPKQVKVDQEEVEHKQEEIELKKEPIIPDQISNKEINLAEHYQKVLKEQEEERLKIKPKF